MVRERGQVHANMKMEKNTQESGKMISGMVRVNTHCQMDNSMMETGW